MSLKKQQHNAHIAQLSCTLVCLEPTALFWDNIRGFKLEYRTTCLRIADVKTVSFSFSGCFFPPLFISTHLLVSCYVSVSLLVILLFHQRFFFTSPQLMFQCFEPTWLSKTDFKEKKLPYAGESNATSWFCLIWLYWNSLLKNVQWHELFSTFGEQT